jgi:hypothetical protein
MIRCVENNAMPVQTCPVGNAALPQDLSPQRVDQLIHLVDEVLHLLLIVAAIGSTNSVTVFSTPCASRAATCSVGMDSPPSMRLIMSRETPHFIHSAYMLRPQASRSSWSRRGNLSRMRSA